MQSGGGGWEGCLGVGCAGGSWILNQGPQQPSPRTLLDPLDSIESSSNLEVALLIFDRQKINRICTNMVSIDAILLQIQENQ